MDILKALYLETVLELIHLDLRKANTHGNSQANSIERIRKTYESNLKAIISSFCMKTNKALKKKSNAFLVRHFESISKSESDDVKDELRNVIESAFAGSLSDDILDALGPMIDDLATFFKTTYEVDINYAKVNERATEFLRTRLDNSFSSLSVDAANGIYGKIADSMSDVKDGYSVKSIISNIWDDAFALSENGYVPTASRNIETGYWCELVAKSETAAAASASTRSVAEDAGLQTWTWAANIGACEICEPNDGETVTIGDEFPSGDDEAPAHSACRCVCVLNRAEIDALSDDDSTESE